LMFFFFEGVPHRNGEFPLWQISAISKAGLSAPARTTHKSIQIPRSRPTWLNRDIVTRQLPEDAKQHRARQYERDADDERLEGTPT
jgi:hypothetical protein